METTCFHGELEDLELVRERIFFSFSILSNASNSAMALEAAG